MNTENICTTQNGLKPDRCNSSDAADTYFISGTPLPQYNRIDLKAGQKLYNDRFIIDGLIGTGAYSQVYKAFDSIRNETVALKIVNITTADSHLQEQIQNELTCCDLVSDFSHVIRIYDMYICHYSCNKLLLLSMEYAENSTFRRWLKDNSSDTAKRIKEGLSYFKQICAGVNSLHKAGIVHLDIKPENLLFTAGNIKVSDLGISRYFACRGCCDRNKTDTSFGTAAYMSPEQFEAPHPDQIDTRADIYSLGVILFEIIHPSCRPPFGGSYRQIRTGHLIKRPALEELPESPLKEIAKKCLSKDPRERYQSITELLDDLEGNNKKSCDEQYANKQKICQLWQLACQDIESGNLCSAAQLCGKILEIEPGHIDAHSLQQQINSRFHKARQFYKAIETNLDSRSLEDLMDLLCEAVEMFPDHPDGHLVQVQLASKAKNFKEAIDDGIKAMSQGKIELAQNAFQRAARINVNCSQAAYMVDLASRTIQWLNDSRAQIDSAIEQRNWDKALSLARQVDQQMTDLQQLNLTD